MSDASSAHCRSSTTIASGARRDSRTASSNTASLTGPGSAPVASPGSNARNARAAAPAKSWSLAAAGRPSTSGRSTCRTMPYARSLSNSPPRAGGTESSSPAPSRAASTRHVLPIPAGPCTISAPPSPRAPDSRSRAITDSSSLRSRRSAVTRLPRLRGGRVLVGRGSFGRRPGAVFGRGHAVVGRGGVGLRLLPGGLLRPHRREQHRHVAPVQVRPLLHDAPFGDVLGELHQEPLAALRVRRLAAAEHDRDLHAVLVLQEPLDVVLLRLVVVRRDLGAQLDLAHRHLLLVLACLLRLLLLLVLVLRVVEHAANRRARLGSDLHEIEVALAGVGERVVARQHTDLVAVLADQTHLGDTDALV